jgi:hypothetical protein
VEVLGKPGAYKAVAFLRPHFQLDELTVSLRLVADLPQPAGKNRIPRVLAPLSGWAQQTDPFPSPGIIPHRASGRAGASSECVGHVR